MLQQAAALNSGGGVFGYQMKDPHRFGIVELNEQSKAVSFEEKPKKLKSHYAVTDLCYYDHPVIDIAKNIQPSDRGYLEFTTVNDVYLKRGELCVQRLGRGFAWLDTGTHQSLLDAAHFVETAESRQGYKIDCLEEIVFNQNWLSAEEVQEIASKLNKNSYGD